MYSCLRFHFGMVVVPYQFSPFDSDFFWVHWVLKIRKCIYNFSVTPSVLIAYNRSLWTILETCIMLIFYVGSFVSSANWNSFSHTLFRLYCKSLMSLRLLLSTIRSANIRLAFGWNNYVRHIFLPETHKREHEIPRGLISWSNISPQILFTPRNSRFMDSIGAY